MDEAEIFVKTHFEDAELYLKKLEINVGRNFSDYRLFLIRKKKSFLLVVKTGLVEISELLFPSDCMTWAQFLGLIEKKSKIVEKGLHLRIRFVLDEDVENNGTGLFVFLHFCSLQS